MQQCCDGITAGESAVRTSQDQYSEGYSTAEEHIEHFKLRSATIHNSGANSLPPAELGDCDCVSEASKGRPSAYFETPYIYKQLSLRLLKKPACSQVCTVLYMCVTEYPPRMSTPHDLRPYALFHMQKSKFCSKKLGIKMHLASGANVAAPGCTHVLKKTSENASFRLYMLRNIEGTDN